MAVTGNWEPWSAVDEWPPGWYADPWQAGRERRWTGSTWTSETRGAEGPSIAALGGGTGPPAPAAPPPEDGPPPEPEPETPWWKRPRYLALVAALTATALILGFTVTYVAADTSTSNHAATPPTFPLPTQPPATIPIPTNPTPGASTPPPSIGGTPGAGNPGSQQSPSAQPTDPNANLLQQLVVREADVTGQPVALTTGGDTTQDPTLDLCNGTYASEALRTARLQINEVDANGDPVFSTEAVLYKNAAATAQAFSELQTVTSSCPNSPVTSPVGEPTITTTFSPPPDKAWPHTPGVTRQAYDLITTDDSGTSTHSYAVYLKRGRALLGLYFSAPTQQLSVGGKTDMPPIVSLFEQRLAALPAQAIGA
jgi:hypothetical protein